MRSARTRITRWRTAAWPTHAACSRTTGSGAGRCLVKGDGERDDRGHARRLPRKATSLALVKATQDWDWAASEREFNRASPWIPVRHGPPLVPPRASRRLAGLTKLDEVIVAQSLDPISSIVARRRDDSLPARDFETALEQCDHTSS
jgi:hypothetical protein